MKINQITIENITSLKGIHFLDFEKILGTDDIFAITGPTGSGKSSILSAIGIALYNSANKEGIAPIELISQGAEYGKIDLHFSVGIKKYRSIWECRLKQRNGAQLKSPRFSHLFYQDDQLIELDGEKILGLSYQQFCKTVILNQGQFAEFLTSKYSERKSILETLFDSDRLTILGNTLNDQLKVAKFEMQSAEQSILAITPLETISLDLLQAECLQSKEKGDNAKAQATLIQSFKDSLEDYAKLRLSLHEYQERKGKIESEIAQAITNKNKLTEDVAQASSVLAIHHQQFEELRPKLLKTVELQKSIKSAIDQQKGLQQRIEKNLLLSQEKKRAQEKTKQAANEAQKNLIELQRINANNLSIEQMQLLEAVVKQIRRSCDICSTLTESKKLQSLDQARLVVQLKEKEQKQQQLQKDFFEISSKPFSFEAYERIIAEVEARVKEGELKNKDQLLDRNRKKELEQQLLHLKASSLDLLSKEQSIAKQSNDIALQISNQELKAKNLEYQIELNRLENAIKLCTIHSKKKSTCIVCHSPWSDLPLFNKENDELNDSTTLELEQKTSHQNLISLSGVSSSILQQLENIKRQHKECKEKIESEQKQLESINTRLADISFDEEANALSNLKLQLSKLPTVVAMLQNISSDIAELQKQILERKTYIEKNEALYANEINEQHKYFNEIKNITSITPADSAGAMAFFEEQQKVFHRRIELNTNFDSLILLLKQMDSELERIAEEEANLQMQNSTTKNEIETINRQLQNEYNFQQPAKMLEEMITKGNLLQQQYNQRNEKLITIDKEVETKYSFINSIDDILKTKELERISYEAQHCNCPDLLAEQFPAIHAFHTKRQDLYLQANDQAANSVRMYLQTSIIPLSLELHQLQDELRQDYHRLNGQYQAHLKNEERIKSLRTKYDYFKAEFQRLALLNDLIGKQEFRDFALSIIERELIKCANIELKQICDARYQLKQQQSGKHKFEFFIIDHFAGAQERKVNTLSGGETFLVSLAMAMALSEMTRGKIEIDSFFIDEGFGSLDEESLNDALETLLQIRNRGKRIGIISHVQGLNERIPVNIKISKNELGESSLSFTQQSP